MNLSPTANRSFLHGSSRKAALISDKVVYATLDSLALKRARLPLQLLPADNGNLVEKTEKADKEKRSVGGKTSPKRPTYKVKSGANHQWKSYSKYLVFSSTKSENQSTRFASALDTGTERYVANTLGEEIHTQSNPTEQESIQTSPSPPIKEKSRVKNLRNDKNNDLTYSQTENNSYNETNVAKSQLEKEKCSIARKDSSSSSDYEKMNVVDYKVATLKRNFTIDSEITDKTILETVTCDNKIEQYMASPKIVTKSMSVNDLATTDEDDDTSSSSSRQKKKKKRRFTRNVLHYVPRHLVKQPKQQKKKLKKKHGLNGSLSSLRSLQVPPAKITGGRGYVNTGIKNLSREELKGVTISSPTNFVHVASATNPDLISNENTVRSSLEQVVITHQQICATLPLLVGKDERRAVGNENTESSKVGIAGMSPVVDNAISSQIGGETTVESVMDKSDHTNYAVIKNESFVRNLQAQAAKVLETGQVVVKIVIDNQADSPDGEMYEPICESSPQTLPPANNSFLWSNHRAKSFPSDKHEICNVSRENADGDSEEYDDVGPSNFVAQAESDYDDVGPPMTLEVEEIVTNTKDCEEIYDDVMPSTFKRIDESDYLIPGETDELDKLDKEPLVEQRKTSKDRNAEASCCVPDSNQYFLANNEYSIVDESRLHEGEERDELGVYDDVGLPGEERVNSLYAGSTPGSVLGLTAINGKESEWEDQEDVPSASRYSCQRNDSCEKRTEEQIVLGKKRFAQQWSRKARRQWSRRSRRSTKTVTRTTLDATLIVAVSLGGGSILLVGESDEKIIGGWRSACSDDNSPFRTQGLVQLRVINFDEDVDTQETSCYVHEDSASDDSTYESLYSCQPDDFSTDSDAEAADTQQQSNHNNVDDNNRVISACLECPMRPTPPPPREASLTQTLGRRIKMLRRTWSITKDSLGRIRRRTSVNECCDDKEQSGNEYHRHHTDAGKYFNFRRRFRKSIVNPPTFYLGENERDDICSVRNNNNGIAKEAIYTNSQYMGSGSDDSSKTSAIEVDHYSVLADQEPLYQFYAAAVARVAFESDSEGYEEVEDMMWKIRPAAADLARSGQRMLWCHTPQVIHSDLLQRLTPEEKKIQEAKFEILTSEASYLNSLRVLENEFLNNHVLMNEILTPIEKKRLFDGVPNVLSASQTFLAELEAVWREDTMLPGLSDVLLKHAENCQDTYVAYCSNQVSVDTTLKELRARKGVKFLDAIKRIEMQPACQNLSLHSFLMLPMQRVTRLPLLADAILSKLSMGNSERTSWEKVLSSLSNVVAECNEGARTAAQEAKMEALARKLEYSTKIKPIVLRGKQLIRSGSVVQLSMKTDTEYKLTFGKKFNKTPLYLLLLTDYLLVTKLKSNTHDESYTVIDACKRNLLALESASEESPFAGRNAMILTLLENYSGRHIEYVLTCENNTERERWLEAVSPPKRELIGETLYESWDCPQVMAKYLYSPNQPDELSLQPGDVINVLRKMADGWYHGEKLLDGEQGWFPANHTKEVASEHVRARNLKQRHRLLALSSSVIQQRRAKQGIN